MRFDRDITRSPPRRSWKHGPNRAAHRTRPLRSRSSLRFVLVTAAVAVAVVVVVVAKANAVSVAAGIVTSVVGAVIVVVTVFSLGPDDDDNAPPRASRPPPPPSSVGQSSSPLLGEEDGTMHTSTDPLTVGTRTDVLHVLLAVTMVVPHNVILTPP